MASDEITETLYSLQENEQLRDITASILSQDLLPEAFKQKFIEQNRRFYVFKYPSDDLLIKSMISFTDSSRANSLLLVLRGGSRLEALPTFTYPEIALLFAYESESTIVLGTYRDGVSEGIDEYGGSDVNDVWNISNHLPNILESLKITTNGKWRMVGLSRGGMQMILALTSFPKLQTLFKKFVSLSGILNINIFAARNPQWLEKMKNNFKFDGSQDWLDRRNPLCAAQKLTYKNLPLLIIQGTADPKVSLEEGHSMVALLQQNNFTNVSHLDVVDGNHCLKNLPGVINIILNWLEC